MRAIFTTLSLILLPIVGFCVEGSQTNKNRMLGDLDIIKNSFEVKYAPCEWKKNYTGWDLDEQIEIAKAKINAAQTLSLKEYRQIVKEFFKSAKDYHVGIYFYSTESSFLPFRVLGVNGKYFLTWIDYTPDTINWDIGDEVVMFDGKPIDTVVQALKARELGNPDSKTDQGMAEMFLTSRMGTMGHICPQGTATVVIHHAKTESTGTYDLEWQYSPEEVGPGPIRYSAVHRGGRPKKSTPTSFAKNAFFQKKMSAAFYDSMMPALKKAFTDIQMSDGAQLLGNRKGFLPPLGKVTWQSNPSDIFHAYIFRTTSQKTIGYVRIPAFDSELKGEAAAVEEFAKLISMFEAKTDALIIDELNNPGGILFYMYALISTLTDKPLKVPTHRMTLTQEDVFFALHSLESMEDPDSRAAIVARTNSQDEEEDTISGYPITNELVDSLINYFQFIINEWNAGNSFTTPGYLFGIETIPPYPSANYTKPIVMLVNHMDFSCGDFLPAILQDNGRATILGTKTAGAGGFVMSHSYPNRFGISKCQFTASIAERLDKQPIENLGVTPDIIYEITEKDLKDKYKGFVNAILQAVESELQGHRE